MSKIILKGETLLDRFTEYANVCVDKGFILDASNKNQISSAIFKIQENQRGLILLGNPGGGKTLFFELLRRVIHPKAKCHFIKRSVLDLEIEFNTEGHKVFRKDRDKNIFYDDLGAENKGKHYGNSMEIFEQIIQMRYEAYKSFGVVTHFSSNLTAQEIYERYGLRCESRLKEMCNIILLAEKESSEDRRTYLNKVNFKYIYHKPFKTKDILEFEEYYKARKKKIQETPYVPTTEGIGTRLKKQIDKILQEKKHK